MLIHKKRLTPEQLEASRSNGRRSHGPLTAEGKLRSAEARTTHGLLARTILLPGESRRKFQTLCETMHAELQPESTIEHQLVESLIVHRWRSMRVWALETAGTSDRMHKSGYEGDSPAICASDAVKAESRETSANAQTGPHQFRLSREYNATLKQFQDYRAWRRGQQRLAQEPDIYN